jgi:hypothetical protein
MCRILPPLPWTRRRRRPRSKSRTRIAASSPLRSPIRNRSLRATRSRSSGWAATIRTMSSAEKSSRSTSRSCGERIGTTGLPWSLNSACAHLKKDISTARTFLRVLGAGVAPPFVDELAQACRPLRRFEVGELQVGVVDRELGQNRLVVAQHLVGCAVLVTEPADEVRDFETDRRRPVGLVLHGLSHNPGGLGERQARAILALRPRLLRAWLRPGRWNLEAELREGSLAHSRKRRASTPTRC